MDIDANGAISREELLENLGDRESPESLEKILRGADTDGSGAINYTEFLAATMNQQTFLKESYLKTAFKMFDTDNSGKIDMDELRNILAGEEFKDLYTKEQLE